MVLFCEAAGSEGLWSRVSTTGFMSRRGLSPWATQRRSSAASAVYKGQGHARPGGGDASSVCVQPVPSLHRCLPRRHAGPRVVGALELDLIHISEPTRPC